MHSVNVTRPIGRADFAGRPKSRPERALPVVAVREYKMDHRRVPRACDLIWPATTEVSLLGPEGTWIHRYTEASRRTMRRSWNLLRLAASAKSRKNGRSTTPTTNEISRI